MPPVARPDPEMETPTAAVSTVVTTEVPPDKPPQEYCFELPLVFIDQEMFKIPTDTNYDADFGLSSEWLVELAKTLRGFGDKVDIECSESGIVFQSESQDVGKLVVPLSLDRLRHFYMTEGAVLSMSVSNGYLNKVAAFYRLSRNVVIRMSDDRPLQFVFDLTPATLFPLASSHDPDTDPDARFVCYLSPSL
jgi:hypothetical protein